LILCLNCRRVWPKGTKFCGECKASLGCRRCPEGHESPLLSQCCTLCGSKKLTLGARSLNLRPLSLALLGVVLALAIPPGLSLLGNLLRRGLCLLINTVLPPIFTLAILSLFFGLVFGETARGEIWKARRAAFKIVFRAFDVILAVLLRLTRR